MSDCLRIFVNPNSHVAIQWWKAKWFKRPILDVAENAQMPLKTAAPCLFPYLTAYNIRLLNSMLPHPSSLTAVCRNGKIQCHGMDPTIHHGVFLQPLFNFKGFEHCSVDLPH